MTRATAMRAALAIVLAGASSTTTDVGLAEAQQRAQRAEAVGPRGTALDSAALEQLTRQVSAQLRCPVCQGLSLADSPSELALEMKDVVRSQLAAGRTPEEVKAYFVAKYGEWILLEPPRRGFNVLAYLLPAFAVVAGLGVIWLMLRRWTSSAPVAGELAEPDSVD